MLPVLLLLLSSTGCEDDEPQQSKANLTFNFTSLFGEEPLMMLSRNYEYEDSMDIQLQLFQFYLTDVKLLKADGSSVAVPDVAIINFGDVYDAEAAERGKDFTLEVPTGDYTGVSFGVGVEESLNKKSPSDYEVGHPLTENYWGPQTGYIFFKFEANGDLEPDGDFSETVTLHIGGDDNFTPFSFNQPFTLAENGTETISFEVDLRRILVDEDGEYVNFREIQVNHATDTPAALFMGSNVQNAVRLK